MDNKYSTEIRSLQNPMLIILLLSLTVFFGYMVGTLLLDFIFRLTLNTSVTQVVSSGDSLGLLLVQGITSIFAFLIGPMLFAKYVMQLPNASLFKGKIDSRLLVFTGVLVLVVIPFNSFLVEWNADIEMPAFLSDVEKWAKEMELKTEKLVLTMLSFESPFLLVLAIIVIGLVPALGEEFLFRGLIQGTFLRTLRNPYLAVFLVAVLFSAFHLQFYGFFPRLMLGVLLGLIYFWSGNLTYSILFHFLNNSLSVIFFYLYNIGAIEANIMDDHSLPYLIVVFSFMVTFISLAYFRRLCVQDDVISI